MGRQRDKVPHPSRLPDTIGPFTSATILTSHNCGANAGARTFRQLQSDRHAEAKESQAASVIEVSPATVRKRLWLCQCWAG